MARQKLNEFTAKKLLSRKLNLPYAGVRVTNKNTGSLKELDGTKKYVVKVDEGIKKRFKKGLVKLDVFHKDIPKVLALLQKTGHKAFLIEEYFPHSDGDERYLALERRREGTVFLYSHKGGVNIEEYKDEVKEALYSETATGDVADALGTTVEFIEGVVAFFDETYSSFLEINPLLVEKGEVSFLDLAVEVDSAGEFFVEDSWVQLDIVSGDLVETTAEEQAVDLLSAKSQASFRLVVLNPNGGIFMLLSGGGASIVVADEVYNQKRGKELANYGEYSGNPNAEETYLYTKQIVSLLLKSKSKKKVLIIAGGVANFTDIRITFKGIIRALEEEKHNLKAQHIKVYVRRGGPYQEEGLAIMENYLEQEELLGEVHGPKLALTEVVTKALKEVS